MDLIERAAVLGAGVMGSTIAAHLANAGIEVLLLDIVPTRLDDDDKTKGLTLDSPRVRSRLAEAGLRGALGAKPAAFYLPSYASLVETGNLADHAHRLAECDWIIEAVVEDLQVKQALLSGTVGPNLGPEAVLSTNTSGLSLDEMAAALPPEARRRFLGTHFFNPPRYMRLMELVPCSDTDPVVLSAMASFIERRLGKGIVFAKNTPNFIGNRIGVFAMFNCITHMLDMGLTVEDVDAITGPATGRARSATFRTADLVGLDTLVHVARTSFENPAEDEQRATFATPAFLARMLDEGWLGTKAGAGFYRKTKVDGATEILYLDHESFEYKPLAKPRLASLQAAKLVDDPAARIKGVVMATDEAAEFAWRNLRDTLIYAYRRIPEIADDIVNVDNAMRWGFGWELGPFETFDALGVEYFVERARGDGVAVPQGLDAVRAFYRHDGGKKLYYDIPERRHGEIPSPAGRVDIDVLKRSAGVIESNPGASLLDIGDGVLCLEFHSKMNAIGGDTLGMTGKAVRRAEREGVGLVVGNTGQNFSVGANLMLLALAIAEGEYDDIALMVRRFQGATMALKYASVPVVVAPFGMALGGGCEYALHGDAVNAAAETYMGLVEVGVGLLPAGGGTKELALRAIDLSRRYATDVTPFIFKFMTNIGMAKVSTGAAELFELGYLREGDSITMNLDDLIADAKLKVLSLARSYRPARPREDLAAPGRSIAASIKSQLWNLAQGGFATAYDAEVSSVIADVITGGDVPAGTTISEQYLLDLEREAFLKLCGNPKTVERVQQMLKTGKPLRN
jgi:3-hydroxyacyl-CoA dehydrogenase